VNEEKLSVMQQEKALLTQELQQLAIVASDRESSLEQENC
jgi:hypothetical protein